MVCCNPPYIPGDVIPTLEPEINFEPRNALDGGPDGLSVIRRLVSQARHYLVDRGTIIIEIGSEQEAGVREMLETLGGLHDVHAFSDTCRESPESLAEGSETTFVIAGLGKFGCLALERLQNAFPHSRIIVLEQDAEKSACKSSPRVSVIEGDAVSLLLNSPLLSAEDFIIPMVPFNVAATYVLGKHANAHGI